MTMTDVQDSKASTRAQWNNAASGWDRHGPVIRTWLRGPTEAMLAMANIQSGQRVLDLAAGAGDQTVDIAARVGVSGVVVATDISPQILMYADRNAVAAGYTNVQTLPCDIESLPMGDAGFDAAICRLGLMFLPNPAKGLSEIFRVLKPGARFCSMVFAGPDLNPCLRILMGTAMRHAGLPPRDPFTPGGLVSLGKPGMLDAMFGQAGFRQVATTRMDAPFHLPTTADYLDFVRSSAGPILQILSGLGKDEQAAAWADIETQLAVYQGDTGWTGPNTLYLTVGQR